MLVQWVKYMNYFWSNIDINLVFFFTLGALFVMHVLSALMGFALPNLIPKSYTHFASAVRYIKALIS